MPQTQIHYHTNMNRNLCLILPFLILAWCLLLQDTHATKYVVINTVPNTPGGKVFDKYIGADFAKALMPKIQRFIYQLFQQRSLSDRWRVPVLTLYISEFKGYAYKNGNNINISAIALDEYYKPRENSSLYFTYVMHHEMAHVFQWHGQFTAPGGLTEGTADYVMVKSGFYHKDRYLKPGAGERWDQGYGVTERFLEFCDTLLPNFTVKLNKKMRYKYSDNYFVELLGKPVDQLWREYKAKYNGSSTQESSIDMFEGAGEVIRTSSWHNLEY